MRLRTLRSTPYSDSLSLRLPPAGLNLAAHRALAGSFFNRRAVPLLLAQQHASTACRHTVSVSISLPSRGAFHLSLTVLVHYRSLEVFSLRQWSDWFPTLETFRVVLESSDRRLIAFAYRAITVYGGPFQAPSANDQFCNSVVDRQVHRHASQHPFRNDCRLSRGKGLGYSRFARHYSGNDFCSSRY